MSEQLVQVGWYCWRCEGLAEKPCRSDNVPVSVPADWAADMEAEIRRLTEEPDEVDLNNGPQEPAGGPQSGQETADGTRGPRNARDVPEAAHSGSSELAAHHRTLAAVARVHADAIRSLHHRSSSQLDAHTARLLHVLDDELARVLKRLAETADALQAQPGGGYDGPSVQEAAADDRRYWDAERDGG